MWRICPKTGRGEIFGGEQIPKGFAILGDERSEYPVGLRFRRLWYPTVNPERIVDEFPAPSFRGTQEQALADIREAFEDGNDVVLVRAPTGSGKSLLARAIAGYERRKAG